MARCPSTAAIASASRTAAAILVRLGMSAAGVLGVARDGVGGCARSRRGFLGERRPGCSRA